MIRDAMLDALAVLFPVHCAGCGGADRAVCGACSSALVAAPDIRVLAESFAVVAALRYDGVARAAVLAFKEQARTDAAPPLAAALAAAIDSALHLAAPGPSVQLVAMPVRVASRRRRGFDPVRLLLRRGGMPRPAEALRAATAGREQKALGAVERAQNLAGSMAARGDIRGARMLLVDDVVTTGATLLEARRALLEAGAEVVGAAVLASTPKLLPQSQTALGQTRDIPSLRV